MKPSKGLFLSELVDFAITHLPEDMDFVDEDDFDYSDYDFDDDDDYGTETSNNSEKTILNILNIPSNLK
jgi:hypothetical protein